MEIIINKRFLYLENLNKTEYSVLKEVASNILNEIIPLTVQQFHKSLNYKKFIRQLGRNKINNYIIGCNYMAVGELTKIALDLQWSLLRS